MTSSYIDNNKLYAYAGNLGKAKPWQNLQGIYPTGNNNAYKFHQNDHFFVAILVKCHVLSIQSFPLSLLSRYPHALAQHQGKLPPFPQRKFELKVKLFAKTHILVESTPSPLSEPRLSCKKPELFQKVNLQSNINYLGHKFGN